MTDIEKQREKLVQHLESMSLEPKPGETRKDVDDRLNGIVEMIHWCDRHPDETMVEYRKELSRLRQRGPSPDPKVRIDREVESDDDRRKRVEELVLRQCGIIL